MQVNLEEIAFSLRIPQRKPWGTMSKNVAEALAIAEDREGILAGVPESSDEQSRILLDSISRTLYKLDLAVGAQDQDQVSLSVAAGLREVAELKLLQAPGLPFSIPKEFGALPRLTGGFPVSIMRCTGGLGLNRYVCLGH